MAQQRDHYWPDLRRLDYSPDENPLAQVSTVPVKGRQVRAGSRRDLVDTKTGEYYEGATIHVTEEKDDAQFVKVFSEGIKASYGLTRTAHRVFQAILDEYERTPMRGGYIDSLYLAWFDDGLCGRSIGMSEYTFKRGLKELLAKGFIAPKSPNVYWVNPALFFRGDRVRFVREFVRKRTSADQREREELERDGQQRLDDEAASQKKVASKKKAAAKKGSAER